MKLKDIVEHLSLKPLAVLDRLDAEVTGGYASDLLSDVMANSREGNVWITLQVHENIVAVAKLKNLAGVILVNSRAPEPATLKRAEDERVPILSTGEPAFRVCGRLYNLLEAKE
jgi:hypothetical protein